MASSQELFHRLSRCHLPVRLPPLAENPIFISIPHRFFDNFRTTISGMWGAMILVQLDAPFLVHWVCVVVLEIVPILLFGDCILAVVTQVILLFRCGSGIGHVDNLLRCCRRGIVTRLRRRRLPQATTVTYSCLKNTVGVNCVWKRCTLLLLRRFTTTWYLLLSMVMVRILRQVDGVSYWHYVHRPG